MWITVSDKSLKTEQSTKSDFDTEEEESDFNIQNNSAVQVGGVHPIAGRNLRSVLL